MKKTLVFALALSTAFVGQAPLFSPSLFAQGVTKKVKDKVEGAAEATGKEAKKVGSKTKDVAADAASTTEKDAKKVGGKTKEVATGAASATEKETKKVGSKTKEVATEAAKTTEKGAKTVADSKPAQATAKAAEKTADVTATGAKKVASGTAAAAEKVGKEVKGVAAGSTGASAKEIADAQSKGMVWVNTDSGIYHKSGQFYGKTKVGKFMTEAAAKQAGYRAAQ